VHGTHLHNLITFNNNKNTDSRTHAPTHTPNVQRFALISDRVTLAPQPPFDALGSATPPAAAKQVVKRCDSLQQPEANWWN